MFSRLTSAHERVTRDFVAKTLINGPYHSPHIQKHTSTPYMHHLSCSENHNEEEWEEIERCIQYTRTQHIIISTSNQFSFNAIVFDVSVFENDVGKKTQSHETAHFSIRYLSLSLVFACCAACLYFVLILQESSFNALVIGCDLVAIISSHRIQARYPSFQCFSFSLHLLSCFFAIFLFLIGLQSARIGV